MLGGWGLDTQAFSPSGADVDGFEFAALDTLHDGLAGHAVGEGGFEHGQPAVGGVVDEQGADVVGEPDPPGRAGGELFAGDEPVAEPAVQGGGGEAEFLRGVGHGEQFSYLWVVVGLVAGDFVVVAQRLDPTGLAESVNPGRMALFDLTSSWVTGRCCELAARGYSRDGKKGCEQIEYGVLTDPDGRPVAVRVFAGNTDDPSAFTQIVQVIKDKLGIQRLVLVGDRGMITGARIDKLRELNDKPGTAAFFDWITALRAPSIAKLARDDGPLQMSLFDQQDLAEIAHPDYPGERLIACRNPALAAERARKRQDLLQATEKELAHIAERVGKGTLSGADKIGIAVGKVSGKFKVGKHFHLTITDAGFEYHRDQAAIDAQAVAVVERASWSRW